jgi:hypothetical protein
MTEPLSLLRFIAPGLSLGLNLKSEKLALAVNHNPFIFSKK